MTEGLTQKQADIYNLIVKYKIENGYAPTLTELCELSNKSIGAIQSIIRILKRKKFIEAQDYKSRTIKVIK